MPERSNSSRPYRYLFPLLLTILLGACSGASPRGAQSPSRPATTTIGSEHAMPRPPTHGSPHTGGLMLGIDVLEQQGFAPLLGKRVGLLTHPAGVNRYGLSTIDVLRRDSRVNLAALYGPEHGIFGDEKAEVYVPDRIDARTGLHVYSLYGPTRKPTPAMLRDINVMVIDLQDIGVRSYTYVSCMRLTIEACFENNVEVIVLDRPNPLGGHKVSGPMLDGQWMSYVGAFQVPYVHAMTIGELARMCASQPGVLQIPDTVRRRGKITVIPMRGWNRFMLWPQTGLAWKPTSPNIPSFEAVVGYAMTGLGAQIGGFQHGIGTIHPFRLLTHPRIPQRQLTTELASRGIAGLRFVPTSIHVSAPPRGRGEGRRVDGVYVEVADWHSWRPTELSFHMMQISAAVSETNPFAAAKESAAGLFNKHVGSDAWWQALVRQGAGVNIGNFYTRWEQQAQAFHEESRQFWFYQ